MHLPRVDKAKNLEAIKYTKEKTGKLSTKKADMLQWRRDKVIELRGIGLSYAEIAQQLQVSTSSIGTDVQYLREQAKESIKQYVTEHLPEQYQICLTALDEIIKRAFNMIETSDDNREKIQAMQLFKDTHITKLELLANSTTIDSALEFIRNEQSQQQHKQSYDEDGSSRRDSQVTTAATGRQSVF